MLPGYLKKFIHSTSGDIIKQICQPLARINISFFLFVRDYKNGQRIWVTTHGDWTERFYIESLYKHSAFECPATIYTPGHYLWSTLPGQNVFAMAREFNIDHGITMVTAYPEYYEFFHFGTTPDNPQILNFYINHRNVLEKFMAYFKDTASDLIKKLEKVPILVPYPTRHEKKQILVPNSEINVCDFLTEIERERHYLKNDNEDVYLTKREAECLKLCLNGKTLERIADTLGISDRTVEAHIDHVKEKLDCYKQFQLGYKLAKSGFV